MSKLRKTLQYHSPLILSLDEIKDFLIILSNDLGEKLMFGFDKKENQYFIDRTNSGKVIFKKDFAARYVEPRFSNNMFFEVNFRTQSDIL